MRDAQFFRRLYQGYAAEHQVSSKLFQMEFETFRLPADFGFDLVVTDQFRKATGQTKHAECFPFALQIKSRWLPFGASHAGPSGRPEYEASFELSVQEVELVTKHPNSGFAFVTFLQRLRDDDYLPNIFWIHSRQISSLVERGYFRLAGEKFTFTVLHRAFPLTAKRDFISSLPKPFDQAEALIQHLREELPATIPRNWKTTAYLTFGRAKRDGTSGLAFRAPWNPEFSRETFPDQPLFSGLD